MSDVAGIRDRLLGLHPALMCDVLDSMGFRDSGIGPAVTPLRTGMRVAGPAFTMKWVQTEHASDEPYEKLIEAYLHVSPLDVIVMESADHSSAIWGELLATAAVGKGATGVVTDGTIRDIELMLELDFAVFSAGATPLDAAGRQEVGEYQTPIRCGRAAIRPGDWVFGDEEGVAVIPADMLEEALTRAEEKNRGESRVREALLRGEELADVYERYGVL